jgi:hypothetical protein
LKEKQYEMLITLLIILLWQHKVPVYLISWGKHRYLLKACSSCRRWGPTWGPTGGRPLEGQTDSNRRLYLRWDFVVVFGYRSWPAGESSRWEGRRGWWGRPSGADRGGCWPPAGGRGWAGPGWAGGWRRSALRLREVVGHRFSHQNLGKIIKKCILNCKQVWVG